MIVLDVEQGTQPWLLARIGLPTASRFHEIITSKTGRLSKSSRPYMLELLAERLLGVPLGSASTDFMQRGSAMEHDAVTAYEFQQDADTKPIGFVLRDDRRAGCSPDRLVGERGLLEIKTLSAKWHVGAMLGEMADDYRAQCQGQLWITGRDWVDLWCYNPELPNALTRIERDSDYIAALAAAVNTFCDRLDEATERLRALTGRAAA